MSTENINTANICLLFQRQLGGFSYPDRLDPKNFIVVDTQVPTTEFTGRPDERLLQASNFFQSGWATTSDNVRHQLLAGDMLCIPGEIANSLYCGILLGSLVSEFYRMHYGKTYPFLRNGNETLCALGWLDPFQHGLKPDMATWTPSWTPSR